MNNRCCEMKTERCDGGKKALFESIRTVSFAMDELRLYLDVHPECEQALCLFREYMEKREEQIARYTKEYGPIYAYDIGTTGGWTWIQEPMPWDGEV